MLDLAATPLLHMRRAFPEWTEQRTRDYLGGFGFGKDMVEGTIRHFSGGETSRLVLATLIAHAPNILLLDEPTNHLDLEMRHALELALQDFDGALVLVSHDRHLLRTTTDELVRVADRRVTPYRGDLDDYRRGLSAPTDPQAEPPPANAAQRQSGQPASDRDQRRAERRLAAEERAKLRPLKQRIARIEKTMTGLGERQVDLDAELAEPSIYDPENKTRLDELLFARARVAQEIEALESEWLELEGEAEALQSTEF